MVHVPGTPTPSPRPQVTATDQEGAGTPDLPAVPPVGALFGSSGFDGPTSSANDLIGLVFCHPSTEAADESAVTVRDAAVTPRDSTVTGVDLVIGRARTATVGIRLPEPAPCRLALNDTLVIGDLVVVAVDHERWVVDLPAGAVLDVPELTGPDAPAIAVTRSATGALITARGPATSTDLGSLDGAGVAVLVGERSETVRDLADAVVGPDSPHRELAAKCVSVIRVNTLAAGDGRAGAWTTPDRLPHQDMWLWDTAFHSLGVNLLDPVLSAETILTMVATARADGLIPLSVPVHGEAESLTQPPILAWAVRENVLCQEATGGGDGEHLLRTVHEPLRRHLDWVLTHRCDPETGLGRWHRGDDPLCRSGESGMDNSPRFDEPTGADVDLSVHLAEDLEALGWICERVGDAAGSDLARGRAAGLRTAVHELLWDPAQQFYVDRRPDGDFSTVRAISGFLPLLFPDLPGERRDALLAALADPDDFGTACPVPSVSRRDPAFSTDMWRGPTWVNVNHRLIAGLQRQGCAGEAARLTASTVAMVERWYRVYGTVFEFYDADDRVPPGDCDRKGPHQRGYHPDRRIANIRDYHWTAALTLDLLRRDR
ncbi:amylo-alpha-1,6-glucosidase [Propionibacteriaceae bacterium Y2011]